MVLRGPARSVVAEEAAATWIIIRRGPLRAATRRRKMMIMTRTMSPANTNFIKLQKQWTREVTAAEPSFDAQKPLKWSRTPIIFDTEDHLDRTTVVRCLPLLVLPTICNLKVKKMLVDGGAGLNLILPNVIKRLQIADGDLEEAGTFQGIYPGRS